MEYSECPFLQWFFTLCTGSSSFSMSVLSNGKSNNLDSPGPSSCGIVSLSLFEVSSPNIVFVALTPVVARTISCYSCFGTESNLGSLSWSAPSPSCWSFPTDLRELWKKMRKAIWLCLVVPKLDISPPSSLWRFRAGAISRAQLEVQLSSYLTVFGLEALIFLVYSNPKMTEGVTEEL